VLAELTTIQLLGGVYLQGILLLSPLTLALAYTYAQENPDRQLSYFIVTFSSKYLPYAMLAMTFVMGSPQEAMLQATGLVAAHAYDVLTKYWPEYGGGSRLISTPQFVQKWFARPDGTASNRGAGTAFAARPAAVPQQQTGRSGGWASGFGGGSGGGAWNNRGSGHRLGGD
jgi:Derlin-2/3